MKNNLKKLMSAGLALSMSLGLSVAAFAEEEAPAVEYVEVYEVPAVEYVEITGEVAEAADAPEVEEIELEEPTNTPEEKDEEAADVEIVDEAVEESVAETTEEIEEVEAEELFDVVAAYDFYIGLATEADRENYLGSLSSENREALLRYIRMMDELNADAEPAEETTEEDIEEPIMEAEELEVEEIFDEEIPLAALPMHEEPETIEENEELENEEIEIEEIEIEDIEIEDIADEEVPLALPEMPKTVSIFSDRRTVMNEGETVTLTSVIEGFENCEAILYVWLVDRGSGFEEVPGANSDSYSFVATAETLSWDWQLEVLYC